MCQARRRKREDTYLALHERLRAAFVTHTGSAPRGDMLGLVVCRNAGVYFSPVNFYLGFNEAHVPTHLLAEVSNTPWNKRHYYGFLLEGENTEFCHHKNFHVSPFNPIDQQYRWRVNITPKSVERDQSHLQVSSLDVRIAIHISDARGEVMRAGIKMTGAPMTASRIRTSLRRHPLMNLTSLSRIYWHALKLYAVKKVPYVGYDETLANSAQHAPEQEQEQEDAQQQ